MFGTIDHLYGAVGVRFRRFILEARGKPDISFLNNKLGVGGATNIERLAEIGIDSIVDLRNEAFDESESLERFGIKYLRIKVLDRKTPTLEDSMMAVSWIKNNLDKNKKVFIHCNLGRGRGPLIAILFLIFNGMLKDDAIKHVKKIRKYAFLNSKQLQFIEEFQRRLT